MMYDFNNFIWLAKHAENFYPVRRNEFGLKCFGFALNAHVACHHAY